MSIMKYKSINFSKNTRNIKKIKFIIIHYTGMQSMRASLYRLTSKRHKVSCHYLIDRKGTIFQLVEDNKIAWHAGKSKWKNKNSLNYNSIGIEISNPGHEYGYRKFNEKQIKTLIKISKFLIKKYKINKQNILGHSDIAPLRKLDPGEKFPWKTLFEKKIGIWHTINNRKLKTYRGKILKIQSKQFLKYLKKFGYSVEHNNYRELLKIIKIFQMRFRPELIDGKLDLECYKIAKSLNNLR